MNEEVSRVITGEADGMNQRVDSRDEVMHYCRAVSKLGAVCLYVPQRT